MKSVFDASVREELIKRIYALNPKNNAEWGKMNAFQMQSIVHCVKTCI